MALLLLNNLILAFLLFFCIMAPKVSSHNRAYAAPSVARLTDLFGHVSVDQGFSTFFGGSNVKRINNGSMATLALDKSSGSGLVSRNKYYHGFFSAAIKLPSGLSSGVVLAFYVSIWLCLILQFWYICIYTCVCMWGVFWLLNSNKCMHVYLQLSNADSYPHNHDEIDFELLGHDKRNDWVLQTNIYANGGVSTGREEKFYFWFDPTAQHHYYSIIWNSHHIV